MLRDEDNAVWPNSAEVGSMLSVADDVMIVLNFPFILFSRKEKIIQIH